MSLTLDRSTELIVTKKIPPIPDRRELILVNELLLLWVLKDGEPMSPFQIGRRISDIKYGGTRETQVTNLLKLLQRKGAIATQGETPARYTIAPKGQAILEASIELWRLLES